jgi:hypothetical protein
MGDEYLWRTLSAQQFPNAFQSCSIDPEIIIANPCGRPHVNQLFIFGKVKLRIIDKSEQCGGEFNLNISALYVNESGPGNGLKYGNEIALCLRTGSRIDERGNEMLFIVSLGRNTIRGIRTRGKIFIEHH